jgi:UPF0042 nucleotide-binding protein
MDTFEDLGYYCVDNLPIDLIGRFAELCISGGKYEYVAIAADARGGDIFAELINTLDELSRMGVTYTVIFLEASVDVLINRYKESRRKHPLASADSHLEGAIKRELQLLSNIRSRADHIIDTSNMQVSALRDYIVNNFKRAGSSPSTFVIHVVSFGFKYGIPVESDLLFDVRFLPNPYYEPTLRKQTGLDKPVADYVFANKETHEFLKKLYSLLDFLVPKYVAEGKSSLFIGIGCTGGQHRSVALAEDICTHMQALGYFSNTEHRDIDRSR